MSTYTWVYITMGVGGRCPYVCMRWNPAKGFAIFHVSGRAGVELGIVFFSLPFFPSLYPAIRAMEAAGME